MNPQSIEKQNENSRYIHHHEGNFNSRGPVSILWFTSPHNVVLVPPNARIINPFGQIIKSSTQILPKVIEEQMFEADPLFMSCFEIIKPRHSIAIWSDLHARYLSTSVLLSENYGIIAGGLPTICSKSFVPISSGLQGSISMGFWW